MNRGILAGALLCGLAFRCVAAPILHIKPAEVTPFADQTAMLGVAHAGPRLVAVGALGVVLLSDDGGAHFRQARAVPVDSTLTAVSFADQEHGFAVCNWGVIIATKDGGETWTLQRSDLSADKPLFGVTFSSPTSGWAVGLWSLLLKTDDGGATWHMIPAPKENGADKTGLNFNAIFRVGAQTLLIPAEQGKVVRSADGGASWTMIDTGYNGSFWSGLALRDGSVLIGGLRGSIFRSIDDGLTWRRVKSDGQSSVTGFTQLPDGTVAASALDGVTLRSTDDGASFSSRQRPDREELNAVTTGNGDHLVFMSHDGPSTAATS